MYFTFKDNLSKKEIHNDELWQHRCVSYDKKKTIIQDKLNILKILNNNMGQWRKEKMTKVKSIWGY